MMAVSSVAVVSNSLLLRATFKGASGAGGASASGAPSMARGGDVEQGGRGAASAAA
jgi:hypothetical protein